MTNVIKLVFAFSNVNFEEQSSVEIPTRRRVLDPDCLRTASDEASR